MIWKSSILGLSDPERKLNFLIFSFLRVLVLEVSFSAELSTKNFFLTSGPGSSFHFRAVFMLKSCFHTIS